MRTTTRLRFVGISVRRMLPMLVILSCNGCTVVSVATTTVSVATTAVGVGISAGSLAVDAATGVVKGAVRAGSAVGDAIAN